MKRSKILTWFLVLPLAALLFSACSITGSHSDPRGACPCVIRIDANTKQQRRAAVRDSSSAHLGANRCANRDAHICPDRYCYSFAD